MSSSHKCAWAAPAATVLSIRRTANTIGPGPDVFLRQDIYGRPGAAPTAPLSDVGARPVPGPTQTLTACEAEERTWEAPALTTLVL